MIPQELKGVLMTDFTAAYRDELNGLANAGQMIIRGNTRISVLTSRLLRIEKQAEGKFCDFPTQSVFNRKLDDVSFVTTENNVNFAVKTDDVSFIFNRECELIQVVMKNGMTAKAENFAKSNLKGTTRTLDMTGGKIPLENGILSKDGATIIDDSKSLILLDGGTVVPRRAEESDVYCFAYGHDYRGALRDFYRLTGQTPLIPRFAFGNWWSRYKAYTQEEYLALMQRFIDEEIPITVATIDMDWHWVDVVGKFGIKAIPNRTELGLKGMLSSIFQLPGWTGYSWNTDLFPDYKAFLKTLKEQNFKITVNLHPADGVMFFEDMYAEFAEFMGIDPKSQKNIKFDLTDKKFVEGYFEFLHHRYENDGVDFWWIDWQQGTVSNIANLDPLWLLNHYHSIDIARDGKRPLILSRYAGLGSHRYPLGFSGDTRVCWESLAFQPYFTANASNAGYSWWSHDIGGHCFGIRDDELYIRWLQFGVFSPIMRLHSTKNEFLGKEPWKFSKETEKDAVSALRFRHRLIPYIYTMNMRTHRDGRPLIEPMYYEYPENEEAYDVPNEYFFGSELIAAPITKPAGKKTRMAFADVWLPEGRFTDIFTGRIYKGGRKIKMFRDTSSIPVLAKEGTILPLYVNDKTNSTENPDEMELYIYRGNGSFTLYEDDGETMNYRNGAFAETTFEVTENGSETVFTVFPVNGDLSVIPAKRIYVFTFKDIADSEKAIITLNGRRIAAEKTSKNGETQLILEIAPTDKLKITLKNTVSRKNLPRRELLTELLSSVQGNNNMKAVLYAYCLSDSFKGHVAAPKEIRDAIKEIFALDFSME